VTKPFTPRQKYRILVAHDAQVIVDGALVHVARYVYGTMSETRRFAMLRGLDCIVRCACGCGVWAPIAEIDFDHKHEHVNGGPTAISNGAPLRRQPCHAAKTAASAAVTGKVTRVRRKLSVTIRRNDSPCQGARPRRSWPTRSLTDPNWKRCFGGKVERRVS